MSIAETTTAQALSGSLKRTKKDGGQNEQDRQKIDERNQHNRIEVDDEYQSTPKVSLDVLQPVILRATDKEGQIIEQNMTEGLRSDFQYLSATRDLEVSTKRVQLLQSYIDQMIQGNSDWEGKVRVVILNKGEEPRAFAYPDGSIFISQSLINLFDSLDEVMAILAHEVGHILNETRQAAFQAEINSNSPIRKWGYLGVGWLHEMISDLGSAELLEKVGLKTTAQAEALSKLADFFGNYRGLAHQAPVMRAVELLGVHAVKDYETSQVEYTDLPSELIRGVEKTNLEFITNATVKNDLEAVKQCLPKLHPRDLGHYFDLYRTGKVWRMTKTESGEDYRPNDKTIQEGQRQVWALVAERLLAEGLSDKEVKLFLYTVSESIRSFPQKFSNHDELRVLVPVAERMFQDKIIKKMVDKLFDSAIGGYFEDPLSLLITDAKCFHELTDEAARFFVDISEITPFVSEVHKQINGKLPDKIEDGEFVSESGDIYRRGFFRRVPVPREVEIYYELEQLVFDYIAHYYLNRAQESGGALPQNQIEDIFYALKAVDFRILPNRNTFPLSPDLIDTPNRKVIEAAYHKVYGETLVKIESIDRSPPSPEEFRQMIDNNSNFDNLDYWYRREVEPTLEGLNPEEHKKLAIVYAQITLEIIDAHDYTTGRYHALIEKAARTHVRHREMGEAEVNNLYDRLIKENHLDKTALQKEAEKLGEIDRLADKMSSLSAILSLFENQLFDFVEDLNINPKIDLGELNQFQLFGIVKPLFYLANREIDIGRVGTYIRDYERLYQLPVTQELIKKIEKPKCDSIAEFLIHFEKLSEQFDFSGPGLFFSKLPLYEDDICSVLLAKPFRDELLRLTKKEKIQKKDYPDIIQLLTRYFPQSPQRVELVREIQKSYLEAPDISIHDKIEFFFDNYKLLGSEGAVIVAEQITDVETYRNFKERLDELFINYLSGNESLSGVAATDILSSFLNKNPELLVQTVSNSKRAVRETSTDLAINWIQTFIGSRGFILNIYDPETGKVILGDRDRTAFISFKDTIGYLKTLSENKKTTIALKALTDINGLLTSEKGRELLAEMMLDGLNLDNGFISSVLTSAVENGDAKILGLPASQMLAPFMFRSLKPEAVNLRRLQDIEMHVYSRETGKREWKFIKVKEDHEDLVNILSSGTRKLRFFGHDYHKQPNSEICRRSQGAGQAYFDTLANLQEAIMPEENETQTEQQSELKPSTEAIIKAGETSPIFVRSMQMAVQVIDFEPAVRERLAQTQDSMQGMEKLRFWDNLLSKAENDPILANFIENDLISLDSYLGGGSLFTTYGATVWGPDGKPQKVVIKMLNPNAEEFIRLSYDFSAEVLAKVEQETRGKTKENTKFAHSLLEMSKNWCIKDINDESYAEYDDLFKLIVQDYNRQEGEVLIESPQRIHASKKVKIEAQYPGTTLNKFLADEQIPVEQKQQVVVNLLRFFDHQFNFSPRTTADGRREFVFHSDPHAGNYMIDVESSAQRLGAIDRSMYLTLSEQDVEMFKLLKSGDDREFIQEFISRCLELSQIPKEEAVKVERRVKAKLFNEVIRQAFSGQEKAAAYLQVILQEFAQYGERYSVDKSISSDLEKNEKVIINYLQLNPNTNITNIYDDLKNQLINGGENDSRILTFAQFRKLIGTMLDQSLVRKNAIEVPLEFRLMIRNIVAMKRLGHEWLDS